jgi:tRNA threonylcarbamoyladenosine biosynthesis protein TsaB
MPLLLNIDTATDYAGICLSKDGIVIGIAEHQEQKNHAAFLQPAIQKLLVQTGISLTELDAVSVTGGPGSYTGIRVGMASAKGLCFALNKPLIVINTLALIAKAALDEWMEKHPINEVEVLLYPMIDARRMEVFTTIYNQRLLEMLPTKALIIDKLSFSSLSTTDQIVFCGNGCQKIALEDRKPNWHFSTTQHSVNQMVALSELAFSDQQFVDLAYTEPLYVKEFYDPKRKI